MKTAKRIFLAIVTALGFAVAAQALPLAGLQANHSEPLTQR